MKIIGLTGGIGSGKTTASHLLSYLRLPVHCSDRVVHKALAEESSVKAQIQMLWPSVIEGGHINRRALGKIVFSDPEALAQLERIVFPFVYASQRQFLKKQARLYRAWVALDIPLLFETKAERRMDVVTSLLASQKMREERVSARPGMTKEMAKQIFARQVTETTRKKKSDFLLQSGLGRGNLMPQLKRLLRALPHHKRAVWGPRWGHNS